MDVFSIISMLGGLAFFLYGMNIMSVGLETMVGSKLERVLKAMTSSRIRGLLLGTVVTAIIQSSSAVTVMLVGLVNSGIMKFTQTIGVIMGTNIGTTVTAWILSLTGIESDSVLLSLLKPEAFSPIVALIGVVLLTFTSNGKKKSIGSILIGFALLMTGMTMMSSAMKPLAENDTFKNILTMFSNPLLGVLTGTVITAIIQSSSASVGILQSLAIAGGLNFNTAIPIIMGQNIGTCITSVISSMGANKNAKRVTVVHVLFNLIGTAVIGSLYYLLYSLLGLTFGSRPISAFQIAMVHSLFNLITTLLLFPFSKQLERLASFIIQDQADIKTQYELLDERLLMTPSFAIAECRNVTRNMAAATQRAITEAIGQIQKFDAKQAEEIRRMESEIDVYEDKLGTFLVKLSSKELTLSDSNETAELLHSIGDFERIADHALNLVEVAEEIQKKGLSFSPEAKQELDVITAAILQILHLTFTSFLENDAAMAEQVEPLEQVIDELRRDLKNRHVRRLQTGKCTIELGFVLSDILTNYERVSDHCSNIAIYIIQANTQTSVEAHEYLSEIRVADNPRFMDAFRQYRKAYALPQKASGEKPVESHA